MPGRCIICLHTNDDNSDSNSVQIVSENREDQEERHKYTEWLMWYVLHHISILGRYVLTLANIVYYIIHSNPDSSEYINGWYIIDCVPCYNIHTILVLHKPAYYLNVWVVYDVNDFSLLETIYCRWADTYSQFNLII